jgi:DNA-binding PadR family transcriptional regulator
MQEVVLALLAKGPAHGYELRQRIRDALGPIGDGLNAGQIYVTLNRLERAGQVRATVVGQADRPDRKVYELTAQGNERVAASLAEVSWDKLAPAEFHLKLFAAATSGLADPATLADKHRRALLRRLSEAQQARLRSDDAEPAALLLEGVALRLQADIRWLEACSRYWSVPTKERSPR